MQEGMSPERRGELIKKLIEDKVEQVRAWALTSPANLEAYVREAEGLEEVDDDFIMSTYEVLFGVVLDESGREIDEDEPPCGKCQAKEHGADECPHDDEEDEILPMKLRCTSCGYFNLEEKFLTFEKIGQRACPRCESMSVFVRESEEDY